MEFLLELIITFIFSYPGGLIRWSILKLFGSKKTLKECIEADITLNSIIFCFSIVAIFLIVSFLT